MKRPSDSWTTLRMVWQPPYGPTRKRAPNLKTLFWRWWTNSTRERYSSTGKYGSMLSRMTGWWNLRRCDSLDPALAWTGVKNSGRGISLSKFGVWSGINGYSISDFDKRLRSAHAGQISEHESQRILNNLLAPVNNIGNRELHDRHMSCLYVLWFEGVMRPSGKSISIQSTKGKGRLMKKEKKNQDPLAYWGPAISHHCERALSLVHSIKLIRKRGERGQISNTHVGRSRLRVELNSAPGVLVTWLHKLSHVARDSLPNWSSLIRFHIIRSIPTCRTVCKANENCIDLVTMSTLSTHENSVHESGAKADVPPIIAQLEDVPSLAPNLYRSQVDTTAIDPYKLKRKIDFRLLPWLALLYLMNYLDRGSIGNARVCTLYVLTFFCDISCTF